MAEDRTAIIVLVAIFVIGIGLRVGSLSGDLWVDEIWSLNQIAVARASGAGRDWIALYFHDNTHAVNTAFLTVLGPDAPMWTYRLLSMICGVGTMAVAAAIGWRRAPWEGVLLAGLTALSYPLVHYAGEARGYGPMLLAAYLAFWLLEKFLDRRSAASLAGFVAACLFGFLSHLTFAVVLAGLGLWAAVAIYNQQRSIVSTAARLVPLFGVPLIAAVAYGVIALNNFVIGGVTFVPAAQSVGIMTALTFGLDPAWISPPMTAAAFGLAGVAGIAWLGLNGDRRWPVFLVVVIVFPLGAILAERQPYVLPRYLLAAAPFALILASHGLAVLWAHKGWKRALSGLLIAAFCLGNASLLSDFFRAGRGNYGAAIADMAAATAGTIRVAGAPAFSVGTMFRYHVRRLGLGRRFQFVAKRGQTKKPADWFILGYLDALNAPPELTRPAASGPSAAYGLVSVYPHWGLSGDTWAVYRRR